MKQTLIQFIVAAVALVILAAVVYNAQSTAPSPEAAAAPDPAPVKNLILTHEPVFIPASHADIGLQQITGSAPDTVAAKDPAELPTTGEQEEPSAEGEEALVPINITIDEEMFLPSTKMGPIIPTRADANE
ncbi:MAG: hypothetical protein P8R54_32075 [Myxococcota bacterium]|nr:hypothetical protein [Myxococcota bacterium]